ncbi:endonuclease/exonuclease/phosphatase family protein [Desulfococcus sp.]|uniref:endonuclease/exonuclease/phosphatase family protein n=1 Tax=Desulfococcus sp. TaxID=2025834 RepID=UPI0035948CAD
MSLRIATFNLENLDDGAGLEPTLADRIQIMRPQLERIAADILCLQEINSQGPEGFRTMSALDQLLSGTAYAGFDRQTTLTTSGQFYDERNIVTLSRFPVVSTRNIRHSDSPRPSYQMATANPPDDAANPVVWERPLLYTQIDIGPGLTLHLINLHLKSKLASSIPGQKIDSFMWRTVSAWAEGSFISSMKRLGQALQARLLIDEIFETHGLGSLIAMAGDFNAQVDEVPLKAVCGPVEETGNPAHAARMMVPCENNIPDSTRYSLFHLGKGQMLDHIIVSRPLLRYLRGAEIHNEALPDESGAFRQDTKFPESDHAPVVAEFDLD